MFSSMTRIKMAKPDFNPMKYNNNQSVLSLSKVYSEKRETALPDARSSHMAEKFK